MKKTILASSIIMTMAVAPVMAHHPLAEINPDQYATVDAQLIAVDSPHLDMDMDDMGSGMDSGDVTMDREQRNRDEFEAMQQAAETAAQARAGGSRGRQSP